MPLTTASYSWFVVAHQFPSVPGKLGALVAPRRLPHRRLTIWHVGVPPGPVQSVIPCSAMDGGHLKRLTARVLHSFRAARLNCISHKPQAERGSFYSVAQATPVTASYNGAVDNSATWPPPTRECFSLREPKFGQCANRGLTARGGPRLCS